MNLFRKPGIIHHSFSWHGILIQFDCSRTTKLDWRVTSGQAKIIGTFISISGGTLMILYKGPLVRKTAFSAPFHHLELIPRHFIFSSTPEYWALGGILLAVASLSASVWGIIQV